MTLYETCKTLCSNVDINHPVRIMKLYESIFDGDCWYEFVYEGQFGNIPLKYLVLECDNMLVETSASKCINFSVMS